MARQTKFYVTCHIQKDGRMTLGTAVHVNRNCGSLIGWRRNENTAVPGGRYYNEKFYQSTFSLEGVLLGFLLAKGKLCKRCFKGSLAATRS
jgi:hypothetical protein